MTTIQLLLLILLSPIILILLVLIVLHLTNKLLQAYLDHLIKDDQTIQDNLASIRQRLIERQIEIDLAKQNNHINNNKETL